MFWLNNGLLAWGLYPSLVLAVTAEPFQQPPFLSSIAGAIWSPGSSAAAAQCWPQARQPAPWEAQQALPESPRLFIRGGISALAAIPRRLWIRASLFYIGVISFLVP